MQCITIFLGRDRIKVVGERKKVIHVFLVKVNKTLDLVTTHNASKDANLFINSFDGETFVKKLEIYFCFKVLMLHGFLVSEEEVKRLAWWKEHANKFPNVIFLGVLGFQIKVNKLQRCHLKITNIDVRVMTFKNQYDNAEQIVPLSLSFNKFSLLKHSYLMYMKDLGEEGYFWNNRL
jgi:hypothetical protein